MPFLFFCIGQIFVGTKSLLPLCGIKICLSMVLKQSFIVIAKHSVLFYSNRRQIIVILVLSKLYLLFSKKL